MSSVTASISQVPARVGYFRVNKVVASEATQVELFLYEPIDFTTATGYLSTSGNIVFFNTYTNARNALTGGTTPPGTALTEREFLRDMGKSIHIEVFNAGTRGSLRVATLTKVQKYTNPGQNTEGVVGNPLSTPAAATKGYNTGYVVSWSANPSSTTGVPVAVGRIGY